MNAQELKSSILQRAIEGKLVPQRKEEGTAKELLAEIRAEKVRLIKEKKIKKSKPLPEITDEEKPFDIPDSWEWVRFGDVADIASNLVNPHDYQEYQQIGPDLIEKETGRLLGKRTVKENHVRSGNHLFHEGQILYSKIRPALKKAVIAPYDGLCSADMYPINTWIDKQYLLFLMLSDCFTIQTQSKANRVKMPKINQDGLVNIIIPLPPLVEQHRIVAKIEELQPDIDAYDKAQTEIRTIEQRFPEAMKKSLLQYAIEGKLVPQRKEEGTAKDLLATIRAEKAQLIKEKKIKKTKPLPAITDDEKPYAIPDSWEWRRLGDISTIVTGGTPSKSQPLYYGGNVPFYKPADIQDNKYVNTPKEFLSIMGKEKAKFVPKGSVAVNCIGNIGKSAILPRDGATNQQINSICYYIYPDYLYWFCQSMMFILQLKKVSSMTTIPIVNKSKVEQCIIPLPPLAEQHRIVAKLEELLPLCQHLTANP